LRENTLAVDAAEDAAAVDEGVFSSAPKSTAF